MPHVLVVHHSPSPVTHELLDAVVDGLGQPGLEDIDVVVRPALALTVPDVLDADVYVLGTTANFGYMSGALKHAFDTVYYPCLGATDGRPWGMWVHGGSDTAGAVSSVQRIVSGLAWVEAHEPVSVTGAPGPDDRAACAELAATVAANLIL